MGGELVGLEVGCQTKISCRTSFWIWIPPEFILPGPRHVLQSIYLTTLLAGLLKGLDLYQKPIMSDGYVFLLIGNAVQILGKKKRKKKNNKKSIIIQSWTICVCVLEYIHVYVCMYVCAFTHTDTFYSLQSLDCGHSGALPLRTFSKMD